MKTKTLLPNWAKALLMLVFTIIGGYFYYSGFLIKSTSGTEEMTWYDMAVNSHIFLHYYVGLIMAFFVILISVITKSFEESIYGNDVEDNKTVRLRYLLPLCFTLALCMMFVITFFTDNIFLSIVISLAIYPLYCLSLEVLYKLIYKEGDFRFNRVVFIILFACYVIFISVNICILRGINEEEKTELAAQEVVIVSEEIEELTSRNVSFKQKAP